jgi:hypothetical protein
MGDDGGAGQLDVELPLIIAGGVEGRVGVDVTGSVPDTIFFTPGVPL